MTSGVPLGTGAAATPFLFIGDMDSGIEFTLIKIADDTKLCGAIERMLSRGIWMGLRDGPM